MEENNEKTEDKKRYFDHVVTIFSRNTVLF